MIYFYLLFYYKMYRGLSYRMRNLCLDYMWIDVSDVMGLYYRFIEDKFRKMWKYRYVKGFKFYMSVLGIKISINNTIKEIPIIEGLKVIRIFGLNTISGILNHLGSHLSQTNLC